MRGKRRLSTVSEVNVTNLVDVTLVLLIIFIMVAPFIRMGIDVRTPAVKEPSPLRMENSILVEIDKDARVFLDRKQVVIESIGPAVAQARQALPDAPVLIEADGRVTYDVFMKVTDQIRQAGITDLSLVTQKTPEMPGGAPASLSSQ
jgi:biopolymer transport protein ExbD